MVGVKLSTGMFLSTLAFFLVNVCVRADLAGQGVWAANQEKHSSGPWPLCKPLPQGNKADTVDMSFGPQYMKGVTAKIDRVWNGFIGARQIENNLLNTVVRFDVNHDGSIGPIRVKEKSDSAINDQIAVQSVEKAAPFAKLPVSAPDSVPIEFSFPHHLNPPRAVSYWPVWSRQDLKPYTEKLCDKIGLSWNPPRQSQHRQTDVEFDLDANGRISQLRICKSSYIAVYDQSVLQAIKKAAPFQGFARTTKNRGLRKVYLGFCYSRSGPRFASGDANKDESLGSMIFCDDPALVDLGPIVNQLCAKAHRNWSCPSGARCYTVLTFDLHWDGSLENLKVALSSGSNSFDRSVLQALNLAAPVNQMPAGSPPTQAVRVAFSRGHFAQTDPDVGKCQRLPGKKSRYKMTFVDRHWPAMDVRIRDHEITAFVATEKPGCFQTFSF